MRRISACLVAASVAAAAACSRVETASPAPNTLAASTPGDANRAAANRADAPAAANPAPEPASPVAAPAFREVTIPAGTRMTIVLDTSVDSDTSHAEQPVAAHLSRPIAIQGHVVLPAGSHVNGVVTDATRSARVKGRAHVALRFTSVTPRGDDERYTIHTAAVGRTAPGTKKKDALEIAAPAAGGAIIGGLMGGKKGAVIGGAVGGGAGTGVVLSTRGQEVRLPRGSALTLRLSEPVTVRVRS
jgi:hypothetical protein